MSASSAGHINGFSTIDVPSYDFLTNCMHCGLCLPTCPTYSITGLEKSSPRGRIRLIKAVADGELSMTQGFIDEMNFCLDCQACETACPAGVKYGALVEAARVQIQLQGKQSFLEKWIKKIFLTKVLSSNRLLKIVARLLWFYQKGGLEWLINKTGLLKLFSPLLHEVQKLSPRVDDQFFDEVIPEVIEPYGDARYQVGFLSGCIMNVAFASVNSDTIEVLRHNHCRIYIPKDQECCGSMHAHNGDFETARKLAKINIDVFLRYELDAIIMNSAGCGALMKEYGHYLAEDSDYALKAKSIAEKVKDIAEFLVSIDFEKPAKPYKKRVAYHDPCHLAHAQKITVQPRFILQQIPGIEIVDLPESSWCCGSAGTYNMIHYRESMLLLDRKMENIRNTGADIVVASNPGCLAQMKYGTEKFNVHTEVIHLVTLLKRAYNQTNNQK